MTDLETLHPLTEEVLTSFVEKMRRKLVASQLKYGYTTDFAGPDTSWLVPSLMEHVEKGDPVDVANICMFIDYHGRKTSG